MLSNIFIRSRPNTFRYSFHMILIHFKFILCFHELPITNLVKFKVNGLCVCLFTAYLNNVKSRVHLLTFTPFPPPPFRNQYVTSTYILSSIANHTVTLNFKRARNAMVLYVPEREENWKCCWPLVKLTCRLRGKLFF